MNGTLTGLPEMIAPSPFANSPGRMPSVMSRLARAIFAHRLLIGLLMVIPALLTAQPRTLWSGWEMEGMLLSNLCIAAGMTLRCLGSGFAGTHTRTGKIEAPELATGGPFAYVRNPIYLGTIMVGLGMVGTIGDSSLLVFCVVAFTVLYSAIIPAEERFLRNTFGSRYDAFFHAVPRLIPRLTRWSGAMEGKFHWSALKEELPVAVVLLAIYCAIEIAWRLREQAGL